MSGSRDHSLRRQALSNDGTDMRKALHQSGRQPPLRSLRRGLKGLRDSENFRLWARFVLPPEEAELLRQWALADEATYGLLVRRYGNCHDECDREELLNRLQQSLACFARASVRAPHADPGSRSHKTEDPS